MNDSAGLYVGGPVPSGLIAASATPATVFTLDPASFTALFAAVCCQQELPTSLPVTFCSDAPRETIP